MWPFIDGKLAAAGCDVKSLPAEQFLNVITNELVSDGLFEEEYIKARSKMRAQVISAYNVNSSADDDDLYGSSNDDAGAYAYARDPLPFIEPTLETDDGFPGLDPPLNG